MNPNAEVQRHSKDKQPADRQLAVDLQPAFDNKIDAAISEVDLLGDTLHEAYKLSWETKQNVAGIVLLDLLEDARILHRKLDTLRNEIQRDRS